MSGQSSDTLTERLAVRLARPVSAADRARAALHLLDWTGCAMAALASAPAKAMRAALAGQGGGSLSRVLLDGTLGNVLEMDDVDKRAILHPGPTVIPAALAAADAETDGTTLLDGIVRGYEAVIRVGRAVGPGHYAFWHNTGTCGPFGAAAAASSVLGLDARLTAQALGLAGTQASGFWQTRHEPASMAKQLHTARAAHAGLLAATLAAGGFKGPLAILEGKQGFFAATCPGADPDTVLAGADDGWAIHEVSFKPWPACRHAHAAIDAALMARDVGITPERINRIDIITYPDAVTFCDRSVPDSVIGAKFSLQHSAAVALVRGAPSLSDFEPAAIADQEIAALRARIRVRSGEPYASAYPARYGAGLALTLTDGTTRDIAAPDALGDPENPVDRNRLIGKARTLCAAGGLPGRDSEVLIAAALALAQGGRLADYATALERARNREAA